MSRNFTANPVTLVVIKSTILRTPFHPRLLFRGTYTLAEVKNAACVMTVYDRDAKSVDRDSIVADLDRCGQAGAGQAPAVFEIPKDKPAFFTTGHGEMAVVGDSHLDEFVRPRQFLEAASGYEVPGGESTGLRDDGASEVGRASHDRILVEIGPNLNSGAGESPNTDARRVNPVADVVRQVGETTAIRSDRKTAVFAAVVVEALDLNVGASVVDSDFVST